MGHYESFYVVWKLTIVVFYYNETICELVNNIKNNIQNHSFEGENRLERPLVSPPFANKSEHSPCLCMKLVVYHSSSAKVALFDKILQLVHVYYLVIVQVHKLVLLGEGPEAL